MLTEFLGNDLSKIAGELENFAFWSQKDQKLQISLLKKI